MELLLARATLQLRNRAIRSVNDAEANHAVVQSGELFIEIILPQDHPVENGTILKGRSSLNMQIEYETSLEPGGLERYEAVASSFSTAPVQRQFGVRTRP